MKPDLYLKTILTIIAVCLIIIAARTVPLISIAKAEGYMHCSGELKANAWGGIKESIGGYTVDVTCN